MSPHEQEISLPVTLQAMSPDGVCLVIRAANDDLFSKDSLSPDEFRPVEESDVMAGIQHGNICFEESEFETLEALEEFRQNRAIEAFKISD